MTPLEIQLKKEVDRLMRLLKCKQAECDCILPKITTQPLGQIVEEGDTVILTVVATGEGLSYQWKFNGVNIVGAYSDTLIIENVTEEDLGAYTVVVSNSCGERSSTAAIISFEPSPLIVYGTWIDSDEDDAFTVLQTNDPYTYQWTELIEDNANICADFRPGSLINRQFILKVPKSQSIKVNWYNTQFNLGTIIPEDQAFHLPIISTYNDYVYYVSRGSIGLDINSLTCFNSQPLS